MISLDTLRTVLTDVAGTGPLLTVQPGGNFGDRLIYDGFDRFVSSTDVATVPFGSGDFRHDAPRTTFPSRNVVRNIRIVRNRLKYVRNRIQRSPSAVYIHGGGNFNDIWGLGIRCFELVSALFDCPIVVGPQSCWFDETDPQALFAGVSNRVHFCCRERYSYRILERVANEVEGLDVYLEHDTAFALGPADLPTGEVKNDYSLVAFRDDRDSAGPTIETEIQPPVVVRDVSTSAATYEEFVTTVAGASHVFTDRLHGMILGAILGKSVTGYDTGYHKNRGVYEYSLSDNPDVCFEYLR